MHITQHMSVALANNLQWKAGTDRLASRPHHRPDFADFIVEYALNAVNQGVTALGIKGTST